RGVRRDALQEHQLVEAEPERGTDGRVETSERRAHEPGQGVVEAPLPGEGAVDEARGERRVGGVPVRRRSALAEDEVGEGTGGLDAHEDLVRQSAGIDARGYSPPRHVPGASGCPARNSAAVSRRRPSSWTSSSRTIPLPVPTAIPSGPAPTMRPGAPW